MNNIDNWSRIRDDFAMLLSHIVTLPAARWHPGEGDGELPPIRFEPRWIAWGDMYGIRDDPWVKRFQVIARNAMQLLPADKTHHGNPFMSWMQHVFETAETGDVPGCVAQKRVWLPGFSRRLRDLSDTVDRDVATLYGESREPLMQFDCSRWYQKLDCIIAASIAITDHAMREEKVIAASIAITHHAVRDEEIIDTHEAKQILATRSNKSLQRWTRDAGVTSISRGRWRKREIYEVKRKRDEET